MRRSGLLLTAFCLIAISIPRQAEPSDDSQSAENSSWTFTYLKATKGNRDSLQKFIEKNWFVMDKIAVERGLFKSYRLIENITESESRGESDWDFIVAVEYFGSQSYTDVQQQFEEIRSQHETVLIGGRTLRDLGSIVRSERVLIH